MTIPAYPLSWPDGWPRTASYKRATARFGTKRQGDAAAFHRIQLAYDWFCKERGL